MREVLGADWSTFNTGEIAQTDVQRLAAAGIEHAWLGFDPTPQSQQVQRAIVGAGMGWSAYRFLYPGLSAETQVDSVVKGCHMASTVPVYLAIDVEEYQGVAPSKALISAAMDRVEASDIRPVGTLVKPVIYSGKWVWDAHYGDWDEPARRGWALWNAAYGSPPWQFQLYGGWVPEMLIGHQYAGDSTGIVSFKIDLNRFRLPDPTPTPPGGGINVPSAISRMNRAKAEIDAALANLRS
jgi:hypothetical protein